MPLDDLRSIGEGIVLVTRRGPAEVARYLAAFDHGSSPAGAGAGLPCQDCFVRGEAGRLQLLPTAGQLGTAQCDRCRVTFEYLDR